jgi:membrane-associated PAP2 superfamily phosphatase
MRPNKRQRCFPAAHASGGFALLSLYFLFKKRRNRRLALGFALTLGWLMGGYKMVVGDHFISHTLITMELAWLLINFVAFFENYIWSASATIDNVVTRTPG